MKICEDCTKNTICTYYDKEAKQKTGNCPGWRWYRKCWVTWLIIAAVLIGGCAMLEHTDKDGNVTRYFRIGNQSIGEGMLTLPDGSELLFEGQKSELPKVEITANSITIGGKAVGQ